MNIHTSASRDSPACRQVSAFFLLTGKYGLEFGPEYVSANWRLLPEKQGVNERMIWN